MLGQPISMLIPRVVGFKLTGELPAGTTATDLVLTITEMLREHGVVGKFVEFYGEGVSAVPLANRATIGNMSPEFGSTCAIFPIDGETVKYLQLTGRPAEQVALVEAYAKEQGLWHDAAHEADYSEYLELDLSTVVPSIAGPKRPQDRIALSDAKQAWRTAVRDYVEDDSVRGPLDEATAESFPASDSPAIAHNGARRQAVRADRRARRPTGRATRRPVSLGRRRVRARPRRRRDRRDHLLHQHLQPLGHDRRGAARQEGGRARPDPQAVGEDLARPGLARSSRTTTTARASRRTSRSSASTWSATAARPASATPARCRTRSAQAVNDADLAVAAVLSGNRNFEGRINPDVKMNYLASPPLVVAYALAGSMDIDIANEPARHRLRRRAGVPGGHLAVPAGGRGGRRVGDRPGDVQPRLRRRVRRRAALAGPAGPERQHLRVGRRLDLRPQGALLRRHGRASRSRSPTSTARRSSRCSATRSPPTTSRRPARSRRTARRAATSPSTASSAATSTPTAPAAATTR